MTYVISHPLKDHTKLEVREFRSANVAADFRSSHLGLVTFAVSSYTDLKPLKDESLLVLVNKNNKVPVTRFANRDAAMMAAFKSLEGQAMPDKTKVKETAEPKAKAEPKPKGEPKKREPKVIDYKPKDAAAVKVVRAGTKIATMIDMLAAPGGTTLEKLGKALSAVGKPVDPRAWLGYDLNKVAGYGAVEKDGVLHLVLPKGMKAPHAHKVPEVKAKAEPKAKAPAKVKGEVEVVVVADAPAAKAAPAAKVAAKAAPAKVAAKKTAKS